MAIYSNAIITSEGRNLINEIVAGEELEFSSAKTGSGTINPNDVEKMKQLKEEKQSFPFASMEKKEGFVVLKVNVTNTDLSEGYELTEIGVYARKKREQEERLFCVITAQEPDYIPSVSEKEGYDIIFRIMVGISGTDHITISYIKNVYALTEDLNRYEAQAEADREVLNRRIDEIKIGGRNLIKNSGIRNIFTEQPGTSRWSYELITDHEAISGYTHVYTCVTEGTKGRFGFVNLNLTIGETYTLSFWCKCSQVCNFRFPFGAERHENSYAEAGTVTTSWTKRTQTFIANASNPAFVFYPDGLVGFKLWVRDFKLERGNQATDWTPAPEDIEQKIEGIKIGGRNLVLETATAKSMSGDNRQNQAFAIYKFSDEIAKHAGEQITVSFDYEVTGNEISGTTVSLGLYYDPYTIFCSVDLSKGISGHAENTVLLPSDGALTRICLRADYFTGKFTVRNLKIELGNKATDYTEAPEDLKSEYIKGLSVSGQTITYTKGNGTTGTITTQDTVYTHPATHPATMIVEDANHRFTSDTEKNKYDGMQKEINELRETINIFLSEWTKCPVISRNWSGIGTGYAAYIPDCATGNTYMIKFSDGSICKATAKSSDTLDNAEWKTYKKRQCIAADFNTDVGGLGFTGKGTGGAYTISTMPTAAVAGISTTNAALTVYYYRIT